MRVAVVLALAVALASSCSKKDSGDSEEVASAEANPLDKMSAEAACKAVLGRMVECADDVEKAAIAIDGERLRGFAARIRKMASTTNCAQQGPKLRAEKHSPFQCYVRTGCESFAECVARVAKAGATARKRRMMEEARKARQ
jgi:hypothetical protein